MSLVLEFDGEWRPFPSVVIKGMYYLLPTNTNIAPSAWAFGTTTTILVIYKFPIRPSAGEYLSNLLLGPYKLLLGDAYKIGNGVKIVKIPTLYFIQEIKIQSAANGISPAVFLNTSRTDKNTD